MQETHPTDPHSPADWRQEIVALLEQGQKIAAIARYREVTGVGLAEAKTFVEALQTSLACGSVPAAPVESGLEAELLQLLRSDPPQYLPAIKRYRVATGVGLKESKDAVDALMRRAGIAVPKGCLGVVLAGLLSATGLAVAVGYWLA